MHVIQATVIRVQSCVRCWEQVLQVRAELLCKQQACQQAAGLPERLSSGGAATSSSSIVQARLWAASLAGIVCVLKSVHWSEKDDYRPRATRAACMPRKADTTWLRTPLRLHTVLPLRCKR